MYLGEHFLPDFTKPLFVTNMKKYSDKYGDKYEKYGDKNMNYLSSRNFLVSRFCAFSSILLSPAFPFTFHTKIYKNLGLCGLRLLDPCAHQARIGVGPSARIRSFFPFERKDLIPTSD